MRDTRKKLEQNLNIFFIIIALIFGSLSIRLFYLQVVNSKIFQTKSEQNMARLIDIQAKRGDILDKNNQILATSKPVFSITLSHLDDKDEEKRTIEKLVELLNDPEVTVSGVQKIMSEHKRKFEPVEITRILWGKDSTELISRLEEHRSDLPGVTINAEPMRFYPNSSLAGHILGFVGQINEDELGKYGKENYGINDKIGKTGLERVYEFIMQDGKEIGLKGKKGAQRVEVDVKGQVVQEMPLTTQPVPGNNLVLTIDGKLQKAMEKSMDKVIADLKKTYPKAGAGAAVAIDVKTGAILAMSSKPDVNPNDFVDGTYPKKLDYYNDSYYQPQLNRTLTAAYPPGSTFKPITAMAGLASGKVKYTDGPIPCKGAYWKAPYIRCTGVHGNVNFYRGMAVSCNTYFQYVGDQAGIEYIDSVAREFGLGKKTGIQDLIGELAGTLPSPERKKAFNEKRINEKHEEKVAAIEAKYQKLLANANSEKERKKAERDKQNELRTENSRYKSEYSFYVNWKPYETFNASIGQGDNNYTMLQLANYIATLANGGTRYKPYLVQKVVAPDGKVIKNNAPIVEHKVSLKPEILTETRKAMEAVTAPGGSASFLFTNFPSDIKVGAKTGTAQTGRKGDDKNKDFHGVFVAFAPADNPQIAFAGIMEYGRRGGTSAGLVAKAVFEEYFGIKPEEDNSIKQRILTSPLEE